MQAAIVFSTVPLSFKSTNILVPGRPSSKPQGKFTYSRIVAAVPPEASEVDYSSSTSVFPAEACDTVGGEACEVEMFPEVKPTAVASNHKIRVSSEEVDRDYLEYNDPKTVFPGEACDDLGGEFCQPEYQSIRRAFLKRRHPYRF